MKNWMYETGKSSHGDGKSYYGIKQFKTEKLARRCCEEEGNDYLARVCRQNGKVITEIFDFNKKIWIDSRDKVGDVCVTTSKGKITVVPYDDGMAKGIQILLNDTVVAALDVYEDGSEARIITYADLGIDEPTDCIHIDI